MHAKKNDELSLSEANKRLILKDEERLQTVVGLLKAGVNSVRGGAHPVLPWFGAELKQSQLYQVVLSIPGLD